MYRVAVAARQNCEEPLPYGVGADLFGTHDSTVMDAVRQARWNGTAVTHVGDFALDSSH